MLYIRFEIGKKYVSSKRKMIFGEKSSSSGIVMICVAGGFLIWYFVLWVVVCICGSALLITACGCVWIYICIFDYFTHFHAGTNVNKPLIYFIPRDDETANRNAWLDAPTANENSCSCSKCPLATVSIKIILIKYCYMIYVFTQKINKYIIY